MKQTEQQPFYDAIGFIHTFSQNIECKNFSFYSQILTKCIYSSKKNVNWE